MACVLFPVSSPGHPEQRPGRLEGLSRLFWGWFRSAEPTTAESAVCPEYSFKRLFGERSGMKSEKNDFLSTKTGTLFREDGMTVVSIPVTALWFLRAQDCTSRYASLLRLQVCS